MHRGVTAFNEDLHELFRVCRQGSYVVRKSTAFDLSDFQVWKRMEREKRVWKSDGIMEMENVLELYKLQSSGNFWAT